MPRGTQDPPTVSHLSPTGLSPSLMLLSNSFGWGLSWHLESYNPDQVLPPDRFGLCPISLATTLGISVDFFSSGY